MVSVEEIVKAVKSRKELQTLDDQFVKDRVKRVLAANGVIRKKMDDASSFAQFCRSKEYEELLKRVRKELRAVYGVFQIGSRKKIIDKLRNSSLDEKEETIVEILKSHQSTSERLPYYKNIYSTICEKTQPKTIIDLGCGMNPLAYHHFAQHPTIIASDISQEDMDFLQECFDILKIPGKTIRLDLITEYEKLAKLKGDATLLLKLLDSLEEAKRHISYKIFDNIKTPWIIASFPTKSLGGKKTIARAGRAWFERLLKRKEMTWETFSVENELFYIIKNR